MPGMNLQQKVAVLH